MKKKSSAERKLHNCFLQTDMCVAPFKLLYPDVNLKTTQLNQATAYTYSWPAGCCRAKDENVGRSHAHAPILKLPGWPCWQLLGRYWDEHGVPPDST